MVSTGLTRARRFKAALALDPLPASKVQSGPLQFADIDKHNTGGLMSARESFCRGFGSRWFTERFHRNALVTHFQHGQVFCTARRLENYTIAR